MAAVEIISRLEDYVPNGQICVGIPAHNNESGIGKVLANLASQSRPTGTKLNILVYANGCNDGTADQAKIAASQFENGRDVVIKVAEDKVPSQANALNKITDYFSDQPIVLEVQDDVDPKPGTLHNCWLAAHQKSDRGVMGVPSGVVLRDNSFWERVSHLVAKATILPISERYIVDRLCAYRPSIIGTFPDIVSVDCFMMLQSVKKSSGYGILCRELGEVCTRIPSTSKDIIKQRIMHDRGYAQALNLPGYRDMLPKLNNGVEKINWRDKIVLENEDALVKFFALCLVGMGGIGFRLLTKRFPYNSSRRDRIKTAVS